MINVGLEDVEFIKYATVSKIDPILSSVREKLDLLRKTLQAITNVDFSNEEALHHWKQIVVHHRSLTERLDRTPDFTIAIIDYFTHVHPIMTAPTTMDQTVLTKLQRFANTDFLTGIYNRHFFDESLNKELARSSRNKSRLSLLFFDINNFKALNDNHGHQKGDQMLRHIATMIKSSLRTHDIPCRYGGDEFICILPDTHYFFALVIAERIRRSVAESAATLVPAPDLSLSYGIATYPLDSDKPEDLIRVCDIRLYESKVEYIERRKGSLVERRDYPRIKTPGAGGILFKTNLEKRDVTMLDISPGGISFCCPQAIEAGSMFQMQLFLKPPFSTAWVTVEPCHLQRQTGGEYRIGGRLADINFV
ncbi:MAG: diguanylate cyclase [Acidobacteria bacterium]|nr:diguanylate cyclase [Acidobacteriota bacterium]MBI3658267.1 diguanylate cyclase [Acidobacteriota bacterium]